jgi:hypothetical protein
MSKRTYDMIKIDEYEVHQVCVGDMLPILGLASTDSPTFQLKLVAASVTRAGVKMSEDEVKQIPFTVYMKKLIPAVIELNGLSDSGNE